MWISQFHSHIGIYKVIIHILMHIHFYKYAHTFALNVHTILSQKKKNDTHNYLIHTHSSCTVTDLSVEVLIFFRYHFCIVPEAHNHCQQPHISSKEPSSSYCSYHFLLEISIYSQHHQGNNISLKSICNTKKYHYMQPKPLVSTKKFLWF
jgi:hypothetical protein